MPRQTTEAKPTKCTTTQLLLPSATLPPSNLHVNLTGNLYSALCKSRKCCSVWKSNTPVHNERRCTMSPLHIAAVFFDRLDGFVFQPTVHYRFSAYYRPSIYYAFNPLEEVITQP